MSKTSIMTTCASCAAVLVLLLTTGFQQSIASRVQLGSLPVMHIAQSNGRVSSRTLLQDLTTLTPGSTHSTGVDAAAPSTDTPAVAPTVASPQSSTLPILPSMPTPAPAPATSPMAVSVPSPAPSPFAVPYDLSTITAGVAATDLPVLPAPVPAPMPVLAPGPIQAPVPAPLPATRTPVPAPVPSNSGAAAGAGAGVLAVGAQTRASAPVPSHAPVPAPASLAPAPMSGATVPAVARYAQCGGSGARCGQYHSCVDAVWATCPSGFGCYRQTEFYYQCVLPEEAAASPFLSPAALPLTATAG